MGAVRIGSHDVWPVRGVGRGPLGKGHRAGEERAVGRGLRELGARGAPSQAARASRCWNKGRPATRPLMGQDISSRGSSFACKSSSGSLFFEGKQKDVCVFVRMKSA